MSNGIAKLLERAELDLQAAIGRRAELETEIDRLRVRLEAFREAARADRSETSPEPAHRRNGATKSPAQRVLDVVGAGDRLDTIQIIDRLADVVPPRGKKSSRKIISSAIYDLKKRGKLTENKDGTLEPA
jgi:uncharacterized protein HemX